MLCGQERWKQFINDPIWIDLRQMLVDDIEMNRDILEGEIEFGLDEQRPSDDALRGANKCMRNLILTIEGWASGMVPIPIDPIEDEDEE
jgi:hypothetical protein